MTCGIYKLNFSGTDKVYIGQSVNIEKRYNAHILAMQRGSSSKKLIDAYSTYGTPSLEVLLECSREELNVLENEAISIFNSYIDGFNSLPTAESVPIVSTYGPEHRAAKYSEEQILKVFELIVSTNMTAKEISIASKVSEGIVYYIKEGTGHTWLKDVYPDDYTKYISNRNHGNSAVSRGIVYPKVISPSGEVYNITNRSAFAKEHNLDCGALGRLLRQDAYTHKGWKLA